MSVRLSELRMWISRYENMKLKYARLERAFRTYRACVEFKEKYFTRKTKRKAA